MNDGNNRSNDIDDCDVLVPGTRKVFVFEKGLRPTLIDRGANKSLAGGEMEEIGMSNKYVTITGMGGTSYHNLRIGDFKSVLAVFDPKDGKEHEIMCIFRNYACHEDPEERNRMQTIHSALQIETKGIVLHDQLHGLMRLELPDGRYEICTDPPHGRATMRSIQEAN